MSNEVKVNPTPIQRNLNDVAMELTNLYFKARNFSDHSIENIQDAYKRFYATALNATYMSIEEAVEILNE